MAQRSPIKCLVWDLDGTLWEGTLAEGDPTPLREGARALIEALDARGFLLSLASRNDARALARLEALGLADRFLCPQLSFGPKSASLARIAEALRIGTDSLAFLDDQPVERAEVAHVHPEILCLDPADLPALLDHPALRAPPGPALPRRALYQAEQRLRAEQERFEGPSEAFLATLNMKLTLRPATPADLFRAEELTQRTHQLNTTGRSYTHDELHQAIAAGRPRVLVADLLDRFGDHGTIGLSVIDQSPSLWTLSLLLVSCRVEGRGIGGVLLARLMQHARDQAVCLRAAYVPSPRNRGMYVALKFAGFQEVAREGEQVLLEADLTRLPPVPAYVEMG